MQVGCFNDWIIFFYILVYVRYNFGMQILLQRLDDLQIQDLEVM